MELEELILKLTEIRDRTNIPDRDVLTVALVYLEDKAIEDKQISCPACNGSGEWETECCDGSRGCSCHGERVPMGTCHVCNGRGKVIEGQYDAEANIRTIQGQCYIGTSPYRR